MGVVVRDELLEVGKERQHRSHFPFGPRGSTVSGKHIHALSPQISVVGVVLDCEEQSDHEDSQDQRPHYCDLGSGW